MKVFRVTVAGALVLFAITAAFGMSVKSDYQKTYDYSRLRTFAFKTDRAGDDPLSTNTIEAERIQNALAAQLQANGFTQATENPDFIVAFYARRNRRPQFKAPQASEALADSDMAAVLVGIMEFQGPAAGAGALDQTSGPLITLKAALWLTSSTPKRMNWCGAVL